MTRILIYNNQMLDVAIEDLRQQFNNLGNINLSYEKASKEKTNKQIGFIFAALIDGITSYLKECGFNVDSEDVRYHLYEEVAEIIPNMVVDRQIFGGKPRIKHLGEMDRELCSKFIDGIFTVIDTKPIYEGLILHPSIYYNYLFHLEPEEIHMAQTAVLPERDEDYLAYVRTLPCIICGKQHRSEAHHLKDNRLGGISQKSPDWAAMPLCHNCHLGIAHGTGFKDSMKWIPVALDVFTRISYLRWKNKKN